MAAVTIRKLPEATHRALKARAKSKGRSTEAEIRAILQDAVVPEASSTIGTELARIGKRFAKEIAEIDFDSLRDRTPAVGADFE
jgi:antitoxin FitA